MGRAGRCNGCRPYSIPMAYTLNFAGMLLMCTQICERCQRSKRPNRQVAEGFGACFD